MYFDSLQSLLTMDGHGMFVWPAYLVTVLVVTGMMVAPVRRRRRLLQQLSGDLRRAGTPGAHTVEEGSDASGA
jgi:heme exporter protein D